MGVITWRYLAKVKILIFEHFPVVLFELFKNPPLHPQRFVIYIAPTLQAYNFTLKDRSLY